MMRMRRIYPALAVLTIASVIVGWFVTLPAEYLAAFAPGVVGADLPVELRLQERQRLFRHGGPDQAAAAHLVAVAGVAVLFLHATDRWPGLAAGFARHVRDQCGGRCAAGLRGPVIGVVSVGKPARCDGIVLLLPAGESLGAVGWRIDRCRRDPAPIRRNRRSFLAAIAARRCRRLGAGRGLRRLSLARSAMARRAHDPADPGLGHDHCGPTGEPRGRPARVCLRSSAWATGPTRSTFGTGRSGSSP